MKAAPRFVNFLRLWRDREGDLQPTGCKMDCHMMFSKLLHGRRRIWALVGVLLAGAAFHGPLLRLLARSLVSDDGAAAVEHVLVLDCERSFDRASQLYTEGLSTQFHYIEPPPKRLVSLGIVPSWGAQCVRELGRRGVPSEAISAVRGVADDPWQVARCLRAWLKEHREAKILVLSARFESGSTRFALSSVLDSVEMEQITFWSPPDPRFDERNWWQTAAGRRELTVALFTQAYFRLHGEDADCAASQFDPDDYEESLK